MSDNEEEVIPLTAAGRRLAEHMVRSVQTSPHVQTVIEIDVTDVLAVQKRFQEKMQAREGVEMTPLPFLLRATAEALARHRLLNASLVGDAVRLKRRVHLGLTLRIAGGGPYLLVLRDADRKNVVALAREIADFTARAPAGQVPVDAARGATFGVTYPGAHGALFQTPIISQPHAAGLSIGRIAPTPALLGGALVSRSLLYLCLAHDHRFVDNEAAALFLQDIKRTLEEIRFLFA